MQLKTILKFIVGHTELPAPVANATILCNLAGSLVPWPPPPLPAYRKGLCELSSNTRVVFGCLINGRVGSFCDWLVGWDLISLCGPKSTKELYPVDHLCTRWRTYRSSPKYSKQGHHSALKESAICIMTGDEKHAALQVHRHVRDMLAVMCILLWSQSSHGGAQRCARKSDTWLKCWCCSFEELPW